jgi:hypothetical protein
MGAISLGSIMRAGLLKRLATFRAACLRSVSLPNEVVAYILSIKWAGKCLFKRRVLNRLQADV